jgi:hypothetical protein
MHINFLFVYLGIGVAAYCSLLLFFRRTEVSRKGLNFLWWGWLLSGDILVVLLVPLLWPLIALLSLLFWLAEYWHLTSKRKDLEQKESAAKEANKYSNMSMDELLAAQKQIADEPQQPQKENHAS